MFRAVEMADRCRSKQLRAGLPPVAFRPIAGSLLLLGAVGQLQFEVVAHQLEHEYGVKARILQSNFNLARWVTCDDANELKKFIDANAHRASRWMPSMRQRCWSITAPRCAPSSSSGPKSSSTLRERRTGVSVKNVVF